MSRKEYLSAALVKTIQFIKKLDERFTSNAFNPNPKHFEDLSPIYQDEKDKTYSETLLWALRNQEVKNIAITGPYGSGKSSILKTFEHDHKEFSFLKISLGAFEEEFVSQDENSDDNKRDIKKISKSDRKRIETSILQQIFYKVKSKRVPFSRFRRIRNISIWQFLLTALTLIVWGITGSYIFKPTFFERLSYWKTFNEHNKDYILYFTVTPFIIITSIILIKILKTYNSAKFQKLNIASGELELAQENESSILNKHLDEILYFFEETDYDVVVIEDLDRFQDPEIFTKLRELNNLINSSSQIKRIIRFVYALKDDIFKDNNRTKFFDFILPVIPVINSSNSGEKLIKKFDDAKMKGKITNAFLSDITIFIEDMRMLKNIYNEYVIYKTKIGLDLDQEKLLGIIVYKNFYPTDFADLNVNKGLVYESFLYKESVVKSIKESNQSTINKLKNQISKLEDEIVRSPKELRSIYVMALLEKNPNIYRFNINGQVLSPSELIDEKNFKALISNGNFLYKIDPYGGWQNPGYTYKTFEKEFDPLITYEEREKAASFKVNGEVEKLRIQIKDLEEQSNEAYAWSLKELAINKPHEAIHPNAATEKLLSYLLRRGFIDEMYHSYISYFYEGTITRTDMDFVVSIKTLSPLPYNFKLFKTDQIVKRFQPIEYAQVEMLNYNLFDYLAKSTKFIANELAIFIKQLSNQQKPSIDFIDGYLKEGKMQQVLIKLLCKEWPGIWEFVYTNKDFDTTKKDEYLKALISHADIKDLKNANIKGLLDSYISTKADFLSLLPVSEAQKVKDTIDILEIEFKNLIYTENEKELFDHIYRKSRYSISASMIELMLKVNSSNDPELEQNLQKANYTTINSSGCQPLINYVNANLDIYFDEVFMDLPNNIDESEADLLKLINDEEQLNDDNKKEIISKENNLFSDLSDLPQTLWSHALSEVKVCPDWDNVILYFQTEDKSVDILTQYLNNENIYAQLGLKKVGKTDGPDKDIIEKLTLFVLENNSLSDQAYQSLINSSPWIWGSLNLNNLSATKVGMLLEKNKLNYSKANYDILKSNFNGKHITLIEKRYSTYLTKATEIVFDSSDYELLFASLIITDPQKNQLIQNIDPAIVTTKKLTEQIARLILKYSLSIDYELFKQLIKYKSSVISGVNLLNHQFSSLNTSQIYEILNLMGGEYGRINSKGNRPKIENNKENADLVEKLKQVNYISTFKTDKNRILINTKRK